MRQWWRKLVGPVTGRQPLAEELREELEVHLEMEIQVSLDRGMSPSEARRAARQRFGNAAAIKERAREVAALIAYRMPGAPLANSRATLSSSAS